MYLSRLDRHISDDVQRAIEDTSTFKVFLIRFGLHNMQEYRSFDDRDKSICIEEYLKEKLAKDPEWLDSIISYYEY